MLDNWKLYPTTRDKDKVKMIHYCMVVWGGKEISRNIFWPIFGSSEDWVRQKLNLWVNSKVSSSKEENEYAGVWVTRLGTDTLFPLKEKTREKEEVPLIPPPYVPPQESPPPDAPPPVEDHPDHPEPVENIQGPETQRRAQR